MWHRFDPPTQSTVQYILILTLTLYTQINENGVLSFGSRFEIHTPLSFPLGGINNKIIAPYWADVDTGGIGNIYYRQTTDPSILTRATSEIKAAFPMSQNVTIKNLLIATWYKVGYFVENADKVRYKNIYYRLL